MLPVIVTVLFFLIAAGSYRVAKSIMHPAFIVSLLWGALLLAYHTLPHGLYPLSDKFYYAVTIWVACYCLAALLPWNIKISFPRHIQGGVKVKLVRFLLPALCCLNVAYIFLVFSMTGGESLYRFFSSWEDRPDILRWFAIVPFTSIACLLCVFLFHIPVRKYKVALFVLALLFPLILESSKMAFFTLFCTVFFALYYKKLLTVKKTVFALAVTVGLFVVVSEFRPNSSVSQNPSRVLAIYALSPLPAFDRVLHNDTLTQAGMFDYFKKIGAMAGWNEAPEEIDTWVEVPVPTNVYTVMGNAYYSFGEGGIAVFALLTGLLMGVIYKGVKYGIPHFVVLYALLLYTLPMQYFADILFLYTGLILKIFLLVYLLFARVKQI